MKSNKIGISMCYTTWKPAQRQTEQGCRFSPNISMANERNRRNLISNIARPNSDNYPVDYYNHDPSTSPPMDGGSNKKNEKRKKERKKEIESGLEMMCSMERALNQTQLSRLNYIRSQQFTLLFSYRRYLYIDVDNCMERRIIWLIFSDDWIGFDGADSIGQRRRDEIEWKTGRAVRIQCGNGAEGSFPIRDDAFSTTFSDVVSFRSASHYRLLAPLPLLHLTNWRADCVCVCVCVCVVSCRPLSFICAP